MNNKMFYQSIIRNLLRRYPVFFQLSHKQYICTTNKRANRPMTLTHARPHVYFETVEQTAVRLHTTWMAHKLHTAILTRAATRGAPHCLLVAVVYEVTNCIYSP
jgi:hypothetical protein